MDAEAGWGTFERLGTPSLRRRAGYVLATAGNAPVWLLRDLRGTGASRIWLDPTGPRRGSYVRDWCLNDNVGVFDATG